MGKRGKTMIDDIEHIEEGMKFKDPFETGLDTIEKRIDELNEEFNREKPMTIEQKIHMLGRIFPLAIGDHVRNSLDEDGVIDMIGFDDRGVIYLVKYKGGILTWETNLTKTSKYPATKEDPTLKPEVKTDIEE